MKYRIGPTCRSRIVLSGTVTAVGVVLSCAFADADGGDRPGLSPDPFHAPGPLIEAYGFGDGSSGPCPSDNDSLAGMNQGCLNSTGEGALLTAMGSTSITADDLIVRARNMPPGRLAVLVAGLEPADPAPFGAGLRVVAAARRLEVKTTSSAGLVNWRALSSQGMWMPGETRYFQVLYLDAATGGSGGRGASNATNGLKIGFLP
jgi:hypothetical protein